MEDCGKDIKAWIHKKLNSLKKGMHMFDILSGHNKDVNLAVKTLGVSLDAGLSFLYNSL